MTDHPRLALMKTYALVVGIEKYQAGGEWNRLDGPASDAIKFAEWLLAKKVKIENIYLFISPLDKNDALLKKIQENTNLTYQPANRENISNAINKLLSEDVKGELLYVFWGGHGFITKSAETRRRLLFSDFTEQNYINLDFNSLEKH